MHARRFVAVGVVTAAVVLAAACGDSSGSDRPTADPTQSGGSDGPLTDEDPSQRRPTLAVYEVTGPGTADITYDPGDGPEVTEEEVELPWRKEVTVDNRLDLTVTAIVPGFDVNSEPFTCRIILDGEEIAQESELHAVTCHGF